MAVEDVAQAQAISRFVADAVRDNPAVKGLWLTMPHSDTIALWLVTDPIDYEAEMQLYEMPLRIHDRFPDALLDFFVLNPCYFQDGDAMASVPTYAEEIALRPA